MMELSRFFWTSGLALLIGGILYSAAWILFAAIDPEHNQYTGLWWRPLNFMVIVGSILIALGLPGFYAFQAEPAGWPGLIGVVMLFVGLLWQTRPALKTGVFFETIWSLTKDGTMEPKP
jgi:hypothetical protein